ncbi:ABC transporter, ATP-binding protein [Leptospira yanagawae serovar Saopaulo str. Sao Paulo = ATCC 700523]|uniref:ABC transporter, ATP-binding protein n=1 Tax=Leptospira yanagawae serovar Saopaulo str. Sao Paulo = ATCC 700523 TaxID=1249483 RepID=A0A5E8H9W7_9LEPT|nr:ATP-binding cassette domain-containing protein [Leptospira yanagawae]EOQ87440.1 ABC transporter, ATP-binding protein [Leptospira yanagawae serovar Saopaulo str. Sao Paulo = ATCC 700523]
MSKHLRIQNGSFRYETQSEPIFENLNVHFSTGWTGIIGKNGSGKSTLAKILLRDLSLDHGKVEGPIHVLYVSQDTEIDLNEVNDFLYDDSKETGFWKSRLQIKIQSAEEYQTLSFGEKRKFLLSHILSKQPEVLILDEPTNHIDAKSQMILRQAMRAYEGIGILISHDRSLLDEMTTSCVFLEKNFLEQRPGNYSEGKRERDREAKARILNWQSTKAERKKLEKEWKRRREEASLSHTKRSKKGLDLHDHDGRAKKDLVRVSGKDGMAGRLKNQIERRTERSAEKEKQIWETLPEKEIIGIQWQSHLTKRNHLFQYDAERLVLPFLYLELQFPIKIGTHSRIAITGANGSGKSSLLRYLLESFEGKQISYVYLPQEFSKRELEALFQKFRSLSDKEQAELLAIVHRLGSDPKRFLESKSLSPGEGKKLALAMQIETKAEVVLLDEPTNHLDLKSVEALEHSLQEIQSALVFVSHDASFVKTLAREEWVLENFRLTQKHLDRI